MTTQTEALKRFLIQTSVESAEGSQIWYVDAKTEQEALHKFAKGNADIYASEVEVTATGEPYIDGCTTLDDFGDFGDKALAQQSNEQAEPVGFVSRAAHMDVIVVNLIREGINKHRARDLADHFLKYTHPPVPTAQPKEPEQEPNHDKK